MELLIAKVGITLRRSNLSMTQLRQIMGIYLRSSGQIMTHRQNALDRYEMALILILVTSVWSMQRFWWIMLKNFKYMSAIFYHNEAQKIEAEESLKAESKKRSKSIQTKILPIGNFTYAEE